ncbi:MAG: PBP1A family penicillin-binding protein [Lachnospiraceae bacterium]|nr:PBP1A family penicillin-binding protein [Lachnospiraceae bacterium]
MNYSRKGVRKKQRELNSKGNKIKKMFGINFLKALLICFISVCIIGLCLGIGMFKGILNTAPDISTIDVTPSGFATTLYDCEGHEMTKLVAADSNRTYVTMDKIPQDLADAFVAIEDARFYEHNGIDIQGILRAFALGIQEGEFSQGASTITQQLIKNNVFDNWMGESSFMESLRRKIQEQYLALELEKIMTKEEILELYMNSINLGQNTLGVQAASLRYFNKPVYELNLSECAVIAGITQNPSYYNPITHPENNAEKREIVLQYMYEQGYITAEEHAEALADDVYARIQQTNTQIANDSVYSYFVDEVIETAAEDLTEKLVSEGYTESQASTMAYNLLYSGGLSIYTTQDPQIQAICDEIYSDESYFPENTKWYLNYQLSIQHANGEVENHSTEMFRSYYQQFDSSFNLIYLSQDEAYAAIEAYLDAVMVEGDEILAENITLTPQPQVSLTIQDNATGHVVAIIGGRGTKESSRSLNRATNTLRQPGSTFKILSTYAPALDSAGLTLASVYIDAPFNYNNGRPVSNWYSAASYKGICSIRYGIEQSLNIVAVKTLTQITPQLGYDYLINFGFTTLVDRRVESDGTISSDILQPLALGGITDGITNLELNAAYATIANGGVYLEPILYTKIVDHDGNVLIDMTQEQESRRVIKETTAFLLTDAMVDVVTRGTGGAVNFGGMPIAGKTGTTTASRDLWFSGFTPYYTATTWTGFDNNISMDPEGSATKNLSKTLWRAVMSRIHENLEPQSFNIPGGITTCTICSRSGKLPVAGLCDAHLRTEYFADGTVPTETCDVHYSGMVCLYSGLCANPRCPFQVPGTLELLPIEHTSLWSGSSLTDSNGNVIPTTRTSNMCPHDDLFYSNPSYMSVLQQQLLELQALGYNFSLEGY